MTISTDKGVLTDKYYDDVKEGIFSLPEDIGSIRPQ
jgi:hypothetical protein